ncbi:MAG TPA: membrane protein insertase YidC [Bryobacteraceae bacterium]|nr:membrane protein insertase YidC [Bryobacteraceae bacterium]
MEDTSNGATTPNQPQKKKELSMELRLLLALVLMGGVMFTTPYFMRMVSPQPPQQQAGKSAPAAAPATPSAPVQPPAQTPTVAAAKPQQPAAAPSAPVVAAEKEQYHFLETDLYQITFSNRGGVVTHWLLKEHKAANGKPLELVNTAAKVPRPFAFYFKNQKPSRDLNQALYAMKPDADGLGVSFEFSDGNVKARKVFRFEKRRYLSKISAEVSEGGKQIPSWILWRGGFGDFAATGAASTGYVLHYDEATGKLVKNGHKDAKDGPISASGRFLFAGIEDTYFAAVFLPGNGNMDVVAFSDSTPTVVDQAEQLFAGTAVSEGTSNEIALFVGPKDVDILRAINPKLEQVVDFGWFGFLAKPLFLVVNWVTTHLIPNYGWAIIVVTVALNFLLFPLKITSMKSMKKMQALAPQIKAIGDKYKGISMRDPRKGEQNQEVMALYKKHGVNPMGGCVPMLLQIPFFFAFYKVFTVSVEMRGASWLWVADLSQPETLPIKILPIAMIVSQFVMQKMTPTAGVDPAQQRMMLFMPLVFGFMFYYFSSGLVLYYLTSNVVGIAQQWFFNRTSTAEALARSIEITAPKKKNGRK